MTKSENLLKGLWKENPILVSLLGLCSTLAITNKFESAIGMGIAFIFVMILSNVIVSLIRNFVPREIRIPIYIVIVATLVTVVEMLMEAFLPELFNSLGIWISLIVVNCIILGRAEAFASQNGVFDSFLDAVGMGIGYTGVILLLSLIREVLGTGKITIWGDFVIKLTDQDNPAKFFTQFFVKEPAAFILLGFIIGFATLINTRKEKVSK